MTSEPKVAFVWVWLPGAVEPVIAGRLDPVGPAVTFTYGQSYLEREDAIPLYLPELPLKRGPISALVGEIPGCIADAAPDAWGQRVILYGLTGRPDAETTEFGPLTYLLRSGSDRIGALDFQASPDEYLPRGMDHADLDELAESAERVEQGLPVSPELDQALLHGSSVGGARPKALIDDGGRKLIAKFSSTTDTFPVVKGEFVAMELARRAGIDAASVQLTKAHGRDALLVTRFDRPGEGRRRALISALTLLELDEAGARYASYADFADLVRARFTESTKTLRELFSRIVFNILCSNNDDHARNHAAFWDGEALILTPAYDICPQLRSGGETAQLMAIGRDGWRMSQVAGCVERASPYLLSEAEAQEIVENQLETIEGHWDEVCDLAGLTEVERASFWGRQFLNPYALEGYQRRN
ncbi:MAG TPA: HipA domain-containing protein [Solirubrobacterales bacterium]|nr:HipA domain-containing protein [Solirubrobacterales bacterium]